MTETVDDALEWAGVDDTEELREPEPLTKLGINRPGMVGGGVRKEDIE